MVRLIKVMFAATKALGLSVLTGQLRADVLHSCTEREAALMTLKRL